MNLAIQTSEVVGLSNELHWSQTQISGNILVALEIKSNGTFSAKTEGDKFLSSLIDLLKKRQPQDKLAFSLLVNQYINATLIQNFINSLIVGIYLHEQLFLFCKKSGTAFIKRGNSWSEIISREGFVSGAVHDQDVLVFETDTFRKLLPHKLILEKFTSSSNPQIVGEKLGTMLHNFDDSKGAAAVFVQFKKEEQFVTNNDLAVAEAKPDFASSPPETQTPEIVPEIEMPKILPQLNKQTESPPKINQDSGKLSIIKRILEKTGIFKNKLPYSYHYSSPGESLVSLISSPRRRILLVILSLSLILGLSLIISQGRFGNKIKTSEDLSRLETITRQVEEGENLIELNNLQAKTVLKEAESALLPLAGKYNKGTKERIQIDSLLGRAQSALSGIAKIYKIDNPNIFLDLTVVRAQAKALNFALYEDQLAVLDTQNNSVVAVNISNLASSIVGGGDKTPEPSLIASHGNYIFVLTKSGLVRIDTKSKTQTVIIKELKEVGQPLKMVGFAGNIYLLDKERKIWKFMALESGYSDARPYLASGETIGLASVASMAIDSSVWVLGDNRVKKYTKGSENAISLEGLDTPLVSATNIFTDDNSKFFYILDKGENRVVVFDKEGLYSSQYVWSGISNVTDMVVSEKLKKILLLSGSMIYAIDLK